MDQQLWREEHAKDDAVQVRHGAQDHRGRERAVVCNGCEIFPAINAKLEINQSTSQVQNRSFEMWLCISELTGTAETDPRYGTIQELIDCSNQPYALLESCNRKT